MNSNLSLNEAKLKEEIDELFKKFDQSNYLSEIESPAFQWSQLIVSYFCLYMVAKKGLDPEKWDQFEIKNSAQKLMSFNFTDKFSTYVKEVLASFLRFLEDDFSLSREQKFADIVQSLSVKANAKVMQKKTGNLKLFDDSTFCNKKIPEKLDNKTDIKKWLDKIEEFARNKEYINDLKEEIYSFAEKSINKYREQINNYDFYIKQKSKFFSKNNMEEFFKAITDFILVLDWPVAEEKAFIDLFYDKHKNDFDNKRKQEILSELITSYYTLYQVKKVDSPDYFLKNIFTGEKFKTNLIGINFAIGDLVLCRIINPDQYHMVVGPTVGISKKLKTELLNKLKNIIKDKKKIDSVDPLELNNFVKKNSIEIITLMGRLQKKKGSKNNYIHEAYFHIQNRKIVYNKLVSLSCIKVNKNINKEYDVLQWYEEKENILGNFILFNDELLFRTYNEEILEMGINFVNDLLSFLVNFKDKRKIEFSSEGNEEKPPPPEKRNKKESEELVKAFLKTPLEIENMGKKTPEELVQTEKGREILQDHLEFIELQFYFNLEQGFLNQYEISLIREKLNLPVDNNSMLRDGVERLLKEVNKDIMSNKEIFDCIMLWRRYKNRVEKIRGRDKSWAAAVDYLNNYNNGGNATQKEIGKKYNVSPNTISQKYNNIADKLNIVTYRDRTALMFGQIEELLEEHLDF
ncbi:MAG: hypothetical protein ACOCRX_10840 [Candidatus Woesearchaeota archaeon]